MKNIHVLKENIHITSDEEIKEGDWSYNIEQNIVAKCIHIEGLSNGYYKGKKIILTTDQDLIKDGVQAIDDEFLEWFVKNPSCEEVETVFNNRGISGVEKILKTFGEYEIIIPKEEPKEETLEEVGERIFGKHFDGLYDEDYTQKRIIKYGEAMIKCQQQKIEKLRDELYNQLPSGKVDAFDLIRIINDHIEKLDELI